MPSILAAGYLVGLIEWTCMRAIADHLEDGERTLGVHLNLSHQAPTPPGCGLQIEATLTEVQRRRLSFRIRASDDSAIVCQGTHERAVVNLATFEDGILGRYVAGTEFPAWDWEP